MSLWVSEWLLSGQTPIRTRVKRGECTKHVISTISWSDYCRAVVKCFPTLEIETGSNRCTVNREHAKSFQYASKNPSRGPMTNILHHRSLTTWPKIRSASLVLWKEWSSGRIWNHYSLTLSLTWPMLKWVLPQASDVQWPPDARGKTHFNL